MENKSNITKQKLRVLLLVFTALVVVQSLSFASAAEFEEVLKPLETIYDLVKYASTVIAGLVMFFAGITYISGGSEPGKREKAKNMIMYVFIGLVVIWAAPFIVELILES